MQGYLVQIARSAPRRLCQADAESHQITASARAAAHALLKGFLDQVLKIKGKDRKTLILSLGLRVIPALTLPLPGRDGQPDDLCQALSLY